MPPPATGHAQTRRRRAVALGAAFGPLAAVLLLTACGQGIGGARSACAQRSGAPTSRASSTSRGPIGQVEHDLLVLPGGGIDLYDEADGHRLVGCIPLPQATNVGGIAVSLPLQSAFITAGETTGSGQLIRLDLATDRVVWQRPLPTADDICVTNDGSKLYLSLGGADSPSDKWWVLDAGSGARITQIAAGAAAHDTICSVGHSQHVYMGGQTDNHLYVADTATNRIVLKSAPLTGGIRPYVVNSAETLAFVTTNGLDGFEVVDLHSGRRLFTVRPRAGVDPGPDDTASHGIALSPDEREIWLINKPANAVDVFDVSGLPPRAPTQVAEIHLRGSLKDNLLARHGIRFFGESNEAAKEGWLNMSLDGRYVYVGDAGDVIDRASRRPVGWLPSLANSRVGLSVDFENGKAVATTTRYATGASHPAISTLR